MKSRIVVITLFLVAAVCICGAVSAADLLKCPDCGSTVSPRAEFCPNCGCPIEYIKKAAAEQAATNETATTAETPTATTATAIEVAVPETPQDVRMPRVTVATEHTKGSGVAAVMDGREVVLMQQGLIEGANRVEVQPVTTNVPVRCGSMELANYKGLARFATDSPDVRFLPVADAMPTTGQEVRVSAVLSDDAQTSLWTRIEDVDLYDGTLEIAAPAAAGFVWVLDQGTNLVALGTASGDTNRCHVMFLADTEWIAVEPSDFRKQSALLQKAEGTPEGAVRRGNESEIEALRREIGATLWLTDDMLARAKKALARLDAILLSP